ncbi:MAG: glycosyltransferase family 2 protein [Thermoanaerobaculales bacterium]|jgi:dolichol-phosphate mannosyltransferase|nr:glycosyltransferase family 2 protein [Thermoanaerobaculales bacterium]
MAITLIIPCHNEEGNIAPLHRAICDAVGGGDGWRLLFVDDGSTDGTLARIKELRTRDPRVDYLSFLTNYGHQKAILAGLRHCRTELALTMDADLQHPPAVIPELVAERERSGARVVIGQRRGRQAGLVKDLSSRFFYRLFSALSGVAIIPDASDFALYDRKAIDLLAAIDEREPFLRGLVPSLGLAISVVPYDPAPRLHEQPSYSLGRSARMGVRALLRFSEAPVRIGVVLGITGVVLSCGQGLHYLYLRIFTDRLIPGQADLMVFLSLIASLILLLLALVLRSLGEISRTLGGQPVYVIAESSLGPDPTGG